MVLWLVGWMVGCLTDRACSVFLYPQEKESSPDQSAPFQSFSRARIPTIPFHKTIYQLLPWPAVAEQL